MFNNYFLRFWGYNVLGDSHFAVYQGLYILQVVVGPAAFFGCNQRTYGACELEDSLRLAFLDESRNNSGKERIAAIHVSCTMSRAGSELPIVRLTYLRSLGVHRRTSRSTASREPPWANTTRYPSIARSGSGFMRADSASILKVAAAGAKVQWRELHPSARGFGAIG